MTARSHSWSSLKKTRFSFLALHCPAPERSDSIIYSQFDKSLEQKLGPEPEQSIIEYPDQSNFSPRKGQHSGQVNSASVPFVL